MSNLHKKSERVRRLQRVFVETLRETGIIKAACEKTGIHRKTYLQWLRRYEDFRLAKEEAIEDSLDSLEREAWRRAKGYDKEVIYRGEPTGKTYKEYSDNLIMFLLKGRRRDVFGDRQEITGDKGAPLLANNQDRVDLARRLLYILNKGAAETKADRATPVDAVVLDQDGPGGDR